MEERKHRVLFIEDNPVDAMVFKRFLRDTPEWEVIHAQSLVEAAGMISKHGTEAFEVVVVDLSLPDAVELETVHFAVERLPDVACVVMTGERQYSVAKAALRVGAVDYLVKGDMTPMGVKRSLRYAVERNEFRVRRAAMERNLRRVLGAIQDAVIVVDRSGILRYRNDAAGPFISDLTVDGSGQELRFSLGGDEIRETTLRRSSGREVVVQLKSQRISWDNIDGLLITIHDLTSERLAAQLEVEAVEMRDELHAVGILDDWHDVAGLLTMVRNHAAIAELAAEDGDMEELYGALDQIRLGCEAVAHVGERYREAAKGMRQQRDRPIDASAAPCPRP